MAACGINVAIRKMNKRKHFLGQRVEMLGNDSLPSG